MSLVDWLKNSLDAVTGQQHDFEKLMEKKDISRILTLMTDRSAEVSKAIKEYDVSQHEVMSRPDKAVFGKKDPVTGVRKFLRWDKKWKIPIPYQVYINEIALVFLYGRPLKWSQLSTGTDKAFDAFKDFLEDKHFNAHIREAKRLAGAETQSAMLYHVFRNEEGKADCLIKVLAKSKGDDIFFRKDQYGRLTAFAWGYYLNGSGGRSVYHLDVYTKNKILSCKKGLLGWEVEESPNLVGKIPVILFEQEKEYAGVEPMINRREYMTSRTADVNDRFSDPALVANAEIVNNMPEKGEDSKFFRFKDPSKGGSSTNPLYYLTWDAAPESKKVEADDLEYQILSKSFTPKIDLETLKGLNSVSGRALKQVMLLADIKADKRKETHDGYAKRIGNLTKAIIGNVLDISLKAECEKLRLKHEFQEPFAEDITALLEDLIKAYNSGGMSTQTFVEKNPYISDPEKELQRLEKEKLKKQEEYRERMRANVFETAE